MGLIKATAAAIGSTFKDQWKEALRCEDMNNDILMVKKTTETGVITNKSTIIVAPGQCAIIYDNGRIIDATAEDGFYTFDTSSSPSFFAGQFGAVFKEVLQRISFDGASAKEQAVFFFNTKEIIGNKFGTSAPIPFQDWSHPIPNQMTGSLNPLRVEVKCFGNYTFKIANPGLFMNKISGTADIYLKNDLVEQMRAEVIGTFQNVLNELGNSKYKVPVLELPSQTDEIKQIMDEKVFDEPIRDRGIEIVSFVVESVTLDEESEKKIDDYELSSNLFMQQGKLTEAYANAVENAANNSNGSANGFMGIGMMNMTTNGVMGGVANGAWEKDNSNSNKEINPYGNDKNEEKDLNTWECPNCKKAISGKFCEECGTKKPDNKYCSHCGAQLSVDSKFCPECGEKVE